MRALIALSLGEGRTIPGQIERIVGAYLSGVIKLARELEQDSAPTPEWVSDSEGMEAVRRAVRRGDL